MDFEETAFNLVRDSWIKITEQWDELRKEHPEEDDLIAVVQVEARGCALMPRKTFLKQFKPPSGFEHLLRPAGELDPPRPRHWVLWILCLGPHGKHSTIRVSRDQALQVTIKARVE